MRRVFNGAVWCLGLLWASPYTLLGLSVGLPGWLFGGSMQRRGIAIEFHGGLVTWLVHRSPLGESTLAITLGHTILGASERALDIAREHEWVHVRQFQRWGPFMGPAYLLSSAFLWCIGGRPYLDNPFEVEAYADDERRRRERRQES